MIDGDKCSVSLGRRRRFVHQTFDLSLGGGQAINQCIPQRCQCRRYLQGDTHCLQTAPAGNINSITNGIQIACNPLSNGLIVFKTGH